MLGQVMVVNKVYKNVIVSGSGEANFDALEADPYQTKSQRREREVKSLLEKISYEHITLDPEKLAQVDVPTLEENIAAANKKLFVKPTKIDFAPRNKTKGKGGTAKQFHIKRTVMEEERRVRRSKSLDYSVLIFTSFLAGFAETN